MWISAICIRISVFPRKVGWQDPPPVEPAEPEVRSVAFLFSFSQVASGKIGDVWSCLWTQILGQISSGKRWLQPATWRIRKC